MNAGDEGLPRPWRAVLAFQTRDITRDASDETRA